MWYCRGRIVCDLYERGKMYRKPNRLKHYDYSLPGYYFLTICTKNMKMKFGKVSQNSVKLNEIGNIILNCILKINTIYNDVEVDEFVIMPNHIHLVLIIETYQQTEDRSKMRVSKIIQQLKRSVTVEVKKQKQSESPFWQRYFYDRVIRNERELYNIRKYIIENPIKWELEKETENIDYDFIM